MPKKTSPKIKMVNDAFIGAWVQANTAVANKATDGKTGWDYFIGLLQAEFCTDALGTADLDINPSSVRSKCYNLRKKMKAHGFVQIDIPRAGTAGAIAVDWKDLFEDAGIKSDLTKLFTD